MRAHLPVGGPALPCPVCTAAVPGRPSGEAVGRPGVRRERGSCLRCGLQLVREGDEPWREIRG